MSSTYSTNLALELIGTGDQAGTWGNTTNTNLGTLIEQAISGYVTQAVSTGTDTTITIPNGATGVARNMYIELTGTGGTNTNLIVPANKKLYFIFNNASGAVTVKVSGQTGVSVPAGKKVVLASNGTDTVNALNYIADFGSNSATITQLTATSATITNLTLTSLVISNLSIASANITTLTSSSATITNLSCTSLTLSNNPTLSGGTANGVLYLNGSKVATSGTGLVFDGTNLLIGTSSTSPGNVNGTIAFGGADAGIIYLERQTGTDQLRFYTGGNRLGYINTASSVLTLGTANYPLVFATNDTEAMRLTSSTLYTASGINVGIGTSSPSYKLHVAGGAAIANRNTSNTPGDVSLGVLSTASVAQFGWRTDTSNNLHFDIYNGASWSAALTTSLGGNLGLGVTPSAWSTSYRAFEFGSGSLMGRSTNTDIYLLSNSYLNTSGNFVYKSSAAAGYYSQATGAHYWYRSTDVTPTAGGTISFTQAMTLDASGNLGIGTSSPSTYTIAPNLVVASSGFSGMTIRSASNNYGGVFFADGTTGDEQYRGFIQYNHTYAGVSDYMFFGTAGAIKMTLTDSGNLGLGVSPSAWSTGASQKASQVSIAALSYNAAGNTASRLTHNAYYDGTNWKYIASSIGATRYEMTGANAGSTHSWSISAGGTSDTAISFTQAMTLDASGNLQLGTSTGAFSSGKGIVIADSSAARLKLTDSDDGVGATDGFEFVMTSTNAYIYNYENGPIIFGTNNTERARITSGGYSKFSNDGTYVSSTGSYHELYVSGAAGDWTTRVTNATATAANCYGMYIKYSGASPINTGNDFLYCEDSTPQLRMSVRSNGGIANYSANDVNLSDERTKKDIVPLGSMWDKFKAIQIVTFKYKDQTHDDDNVGVIAQQVESVAPEFVDVDGFGETPEDGVPLKAIYTADMYHAAIKALQEAMARIEQLEAKVAALESK